MKRIISEKCKGGELIAEGFFLRSAQVWAEGVRSDSMRAKLRSTLDKVGIGPKVSFLVSSYFGGSYTVITTADTQWIFETEELPDGWKLKRPGTVGNFAVEHSPDAPPKVHNFCSPEPTGIPDEPAQVPKDPVKCETQVNVRDLFNVPTGFYYIYSKYMSRPCLLDYEKVGTAILAFHSEEEAKDYVRTMKVDDRRFPVRHVPLGGLLNFLRGLDGIATHVAFVNRAMGPHRIVSLADLKAGLKDGLERLADLPPRTVQEGNHRVGPEPSEN